MRRSFCIFFFLYFPFLSNAEKSAFFSFVNLEVSRVFRAGENIVIKFYHRIKFKLM